MATVPEPVVLDRVPGQEGAMAFLRQAAVRPHHAYLLAGPEGCGKQLAVRAFAATLLCARGGCGECRDCRLALDDRHPNEFLVEPEGRDIHVDTIRSEVWHPAYRTAPEPGKKVFVIREADRLNPAAADTLLKVLEEPPADAVIVLLSARPEGTSAGPDALRWTPTGSPSATWERRRSACPRRGLGGRSMPPRSCSRRPRRIARA